MVERLLAAGHIERVLPNRAGKLGRGSRDAQHRRRDHRCRRKADPGPRFLLTTGVAAGNRHGSRLMSDDVTVCRCSAPTTDR